MIWKRLTWFFAPALIVLSMGCAGPMRGHAESDVDARVVAKITADFFNWYIQSVKNKDRGAVQPLFVEDANGMAALDFTAYVSNLRKYGFSDALIDAEKSAYRRCAAHLEEMPYAAFKKIDNLDDFEAMGCDFTNTYRWTGGQEICDGILVDGVEVVGADRRLVRIRPFIHGKRPEQVAWGGERNVTLAKYAGRWRIDGIEPVWRNR